MPAVAGTNALIRAATIAVVAPARGTTHNRLAESYWLAAIRFSLIAKELGRFTCIKLAEAAAEFSAPVLAAPGMETPLLSHDWR
jgi:hypothetical protein